MSEILTNPRQVKLKRCSVFSPTLPERAPANQREIVRTQGVNIMPFVTVLDIYESIFQNTISGKLEIVETYGFPEYIPFVGDEVILIEFSIDYLALDQTPQRNEYSKVFYVRRVINQSFPAYEKRQYTIELVSPEYLNSFSSRISRRFKDMTCVDAVKEIMKTYLSIPNKKIASASYELSDGTIDVVIPNYTPLQAINYISLLALTKQQESNYVFFETLNGFYFTSIAWLIEQGRKTKNDPSMPVFTVNANKMTGQPFISEQDAFNSIIKLHQDELFDVIKDIGSGMLRTKMLYLDFFARKASESDTRYTETFEKTTHLSDYPVYPKNLDQRVNRNVKLFIVPSNINTANSKYVTGKGELPTPQRLYESIVQRNRQMKEIQHVRTVLEVPGQPHVRAGACVIVNYPSSRILQDDVSENPHIGGQPQLPSPMHSGLHLVTHVRHNLTQISLGVYHYTMHIEVTRDSINIPLVGYKPQTSDVDTKVSL